MCATSQSPESPPHACLWYQDYQRMCGGVKYMQISAGVHTYIPQAFLEHAHTSHEHTTSIPQEYHQGNSANFLLTGIV